MTQLAKLKASNTAVTKIDVTGIPAPEMYYGKVGVASDIWSFSFVMIELFAGKCAWRALNNHNQLVAKKLPSMGHLDLGLSLLCSNIYLLFFPEYS